MKLLLILPIIILLLFILLLLCEAFIAFSGATNSYKNPARTANRYKTGDSTFTYLILGDSTAAGVGGNYEKGIAMTTTNYLLKDKNIVMYNYAVSGARVLDVLSDQVVQIEKDAVIPDLVLISIGGNDVTHLTSLTSIEEDTQKIIDRLIKINCNIKIVLTGSPNVGTSPRIGIPLRWLAEFQSMRVNNIFEKVISKNNLTLAPIFDKTTIPFKKDKNLFAEDKFHPNDAGYAIWSSILNEGIDDALLNQKTHSN